MTTDEREDIEVQPTSIRLEKDILDRIDRIAEKFERSRSQQIRWIIKKYLETQEE